MKHKCPMIQLWSPKPTNCSFRGAKIEGRKEGGKEGKEGDFQIAENSSSPTLA